MNKINLALTSDENGGVQIHLNVTCPRDDGIALHAQISAIVARVARSQGTSVDTTASGFMRLLQR